jgi:hypothetical protein
MGPPTNPQTNGAWLGYMRLGDPAGQQAVQDKVYAEASQRGHESEEEGWYRFRTWGENYGNCLEELAPTIAGWLVDMRDKLVDRLKS